MQLVKSGERLSKEFLVKHTEIFNEEKNPVLYLGIDPGKDNGVCGYDAKFYLQFMFTINADDMTMFLHAFKNIKTCVIEDYLLYPNKAGDQIYSSMETSRVIGRVEAWAEHNNVELIKQGASIKKTGYLWIGKKPPSKSDPRRHEMDGHIHFMYWAIKSGRVPAESLLLKRGIPR